MQAVRLPTPRPKKIVVQSVSRRLSGPVVVEILTPAPVRGNDLAGLGAEGATSATNTLASTIGAGTKFYLEQQEAKRQREAAAAAERAAADTRRLLDLQTQADAEARRLALIEAAKGKGMPSWMLPTIIGGVALIGISAFFLLRKKAA